MWNAAVQDYRATRNVEPLKEPLKKRSVAPSLEIIALSSFINFPGPEGWTAGWNQTSLFEKPLMT